MRPEYFRSASWKPIEALKLFRKLQPPICNVHPASVGGLMRLAQMLGYNLNPPIAASA
jgi:hypothetical protein